MSGSCAWQLPWSRMVSVKAAWSSVMLSVSLVRLSRSCHADKGLPEWRSRCHCASRPPSELGCACSCGAIGRARVPGRSICTRPMPRVRNRLSQTISGQRLLQCALPALTSRSGSARSSALCRILPGAPRLLQPGASARTSFLCLAVTPASCRWYIRSASARGTFHWGHATAVRPADWPRMPQRCHPRRSLNKTRSSTDSQ
jgi:hypothetical protein